MSLTHYFEDSRGVHRVVEAMSRAEPELGIGSETLVLHVNGRADRMLAKARAWDGDYIVVQYVLRSSLRPHTSSWLPLWEGARLVWSYYDLPALCAEDGVPAPFAFYRSPLGVEDAFRAPRRRVARPYEVMTHGDYLTQGTRECVRAAEVGEGVAAHLGSWFNRPNVAFFEEISDRELANVYSRCRYVSGLRRDEGFELPAAEGLCCGSRPIMFDRPHYRDWFEDHAVYVPEVGRDELIEILVSLFSQRWNPVTPAEQKWARARFNWPPILGGFRDHL